MYFEELLCGDSTGVSLSLKEGCVQLSSYDVVKYFPLDGIESGYTL